MKTAFLLLVLSAVCSCHAANTQSKDAEPAAANDPMRFTSFVSADRDKADVAEIELVYYADARDPSDKASRLFVTMGQAFRTVDQLNAYLVHFNSGRRIHFVLHGNDVMPGPTISAAEIEDLVSTCRKAGVWFTFQPGG
jgi:hypothetical protein